MIFEKQTIYRAKKNLVKYRYLIYIFLVKNTVVFR